jgi:6-phosphogluconolactonase (cycloisomerase 2 family)
VSGTPTPIPTPASFTLAYAETDAPGTLRVFDVDARTGALTPRRDVTPSGTASAPVVRPGPFAIQPDGYFLFYSFDSCRGGWCGNVSSYEIGPDGGLRLLAHAGPLELEGGIEVLSATARRLITHWNDAPIHSLVFYGVYAQGELTPEGGVATGYGYANLPRSFRLTPDETWGYGLTPRGLTSYRMDDRRNGRVTAVQALPVTGRGLEMDPAGRFLYLALPTSPPRIEVYAVGDTGLRGMVGAVDSSGTIPDDMARPLLLDANGRRAFLSTSDMLEIYEVDQASSLLSLRSQEPITDLDDLSVHPLGTHLYVSWKDGTLGTYAIDASTSRLTEVGTRVQGRRLQFARVPAPGSW